MSIIDGNKIAQKLRAEIAKEVKTLQRPPGLSVILIGDDPSSKIYARNKERACVEAGFYSDKINKSSNITEEELISEIERLNNNNNIDGILVQLPLPSHIDAEKILESISPEKDVDGFHSVNSGKLMQKKPFLRHCTPKGIMKILSTINFNVKGMDCIVIGSSNIVGRPMAIELLNAGGTVTICESVNKHIVQKVQKADLVVSAVDIPGIVKSDWVKDGAIVIDVGLNQIENGNLSGDVDFEGVKQKAAWITPVPGGVGPMTIATLLENTLIAYRARELE
jgi:methylenetetrahydrofolate dehydrogenase (NADP+)/methenyltetrahydrofolate cyclohydrolase